MPTRPPTSAAAIPVNAPVASTVSLMWRSLPPIAESMPYCGMRRCAITVKLAEAISPTSSSTTVVREQHEDAGKHIFGDIGALTEADRTDDVAEGAELLLGSVEQHRHRFRTADRRRRDQHELVVEVARVLDHADDGAGDAVDVDRGADLERRASRRRRRSPPPRHRRPDSGPAQDRASGAPYGPSGSWRR